MDSSTSDNLPTFIIAIDKVQREYFAVLASDETHAAATLQLARCSNDPERSAIAAQLVEFDGEDAFPVYREDSITIVDRRVPV